MFGAIGGMFASKKKKKAAPAKAEARSRRAMPESEMISDAFDDFDGSMVE